MSEDDRMTFTEHLTELRDRLVRAALAVFVGFFVAFAYRDAIFGFIAAPMQEELARFGVYNFRAIEITETIFVYLKMSVVAGIIFTLPLTFYQLWAFIAPGLLEREKQAIAPLLFFSTFFFLLGAYFAYEIIIPFITRYLAELTLANETVQMDVTVASAFGFTLKLILAFGVAFELPLIMFFLTLLGLMDHKRYIAIYRYFIVVSFIVSAVLTPPDPMSQTLMAVPLNGLYWVGVGAAMFVGKRREAEGGGRVVRRIQSRVWGLLSVALLALGGLIAVATWYFGRSDSPMRWVPPGAQAVVSVHFPNTLGDDAPTTRLATLRQRLGLPEDLPATEQIVHVVGSDGKTLTIVAGGCADTEPSVGSCGGDDLLLGDEAMIDAALEHEGDTLNDPLLKELAVAAPAWLWTRTPPASWARVMPGQHENTVPLSEVVVRADLRGDEPFVEVSMTPLEGGLATGMQARADLWRAERQRLREVAEAAEKSAQVDSEFFGLLEEVLTLSDARFALVSAGAVDKAALAKLTEREAALRQKLAERRKQRIDAPDLSRLGTNAVTTLDEDLRDWRALVHGEKAVLRLELTPDPGVDRALGLIPQNPLATP